MEVSSLFGLGQLWLTSLLHSRYLRTLPQPLYGAGRIQTRIFPTQLLDLLLKISLSLSPWASKVKNVGFAQTRVVR